MSLVRNGFETNSLIDSFFQDVCSFQFQNCKVVTVDGKAIDVGEIHHILQDSFETGQPYVVVATGFSDDVSNTLFVNWSQGKTKVVPFTIDDDVKNINEIKDVSIVSGVLPVSKENGNTLSSLDIQGLEMCAVEYKEKTGSLFISPKATGHKRVEKLKKEILLKIKREESAEVRDLLKSRLLRLGLRHATISVPGNSRSQGIVEDKLNEILSHIRQCARECIIDARKELFEDYHISFLPSQSAKYAISRAVSDTLSISNIEAIVRTEV